MVAPKSLQAVSGGAAFSSVVQLKCQNAGLISSNYTMISARDVQQMPRRSNLRSCVGMIAGYTEAAWDTA